VEIPRSFLLPEKHNYSDKQKNKLHGTTARKPCIGSAKVSNYNKNKAQIYPSKTAGAFVPGNPIEEEPEAGVCASIMDIRNTVVCKLNTLTQKDTPRG
jgi:hypothetical protein